MAISFFERITDPAVTDLGSLMNAGKLRFIDYFPHELEFEATGEESVEFYFHIYNLLGDPELNFWKGAVSEPVVTHDAACPPAAGRFDVTVAGAGRDDAPGRRARGPDAGRRAGRRRLDRRRRRRAAGPGRPRGRRAADRHGHRTRIASRCSTPSRSRSPPPASRSTGLTWENPAGFGNGDDVVNAAEVLHVYPVVTNTGTAAATGITLSLTRRRPRRRRARDLRSAGPGRRRRARMRGRRVLPRRCC